jgi:hypothetical protein
MEVTGQIHASAALLPFPTESARDKHWTVGSVSPKANWMLQNTEKSLASPENQTPTVQPAARHYTN